MELVWGQDYIYLSRTGKNSLDWVWVIFIKDKIDLFGWNEINGGRIGLFAGADVNLCRGDYMPMQIKCAYLLLAQFSRLKSLEGKCQGNFLSTIPRFSSQTCFVKSQ